MWSYVHAYPGDGWATQSIELPEDFKPAEMEMILQTIVDDTLRVYINGEQVFRGGSTDFWAFTRTAKHPLKPGKNIIAVRGENYERDGRIGLDLFLRKYTEEESRNRPADASK